MPSIAPCVTMGSLNTHFEGHQWPSYPFPIPWSLQLSAWGCCNLIAFVIPSTNDVWIVDAESLQVVQTLSWHSNPISCLLWVPSKDSQFQQSSVQLLVGDCAGHVSLWDVREGLITRRVRLPHNHAVANLQLLSGGQLLLVVTGESTSYVFDAQLNQSSPIGGMHIPTNRRTSPDEGALLVCVCRSPLATDGTFALAWSDKVRVLQRLESSTLSNGFDKGEITSKDFALPNTDTIVDICFSRSSQEILYVATLDRVTMYDWQLGITLNDRLLSTTGPDLKRLFPSWQFDCPYDCGWDGAYEDVSPLDAQQFPALFTLTADWKLAAWFVKGETKFEANLADGRGGYGASKACFSICQHVVNPLLFVVTFVDGSVAQWRFSPRMRRWVCEGYLEGSIVRPVCVCPLNDGTRVAIAMQSGSIAVHNILFNVTERKCLVVKATSTQIRALHTTTERDEIIIITERAGGSEHALQVSLFNVDSFDVLQLVREGDDRSLGAMSTGYTFKSSSVDDSRAYLLLEFNCGAFEVWNLKTRKLIHLSRGVGAGVRSGVLWGVATRNLASVSSMYKNQPTLAKNPQQMVAVVQDATLVYYIPMVDKLVHVGDRFYMPWKGPTLNYPPLMAGLGDKLVSVEGGRGVFVARGISSPKVGELASLPHQSQAIRVVFCPFATAEDDGESLVALVFQDGSFGVWNAHSRRQLGYSWSPDLNVKATDIHWLCSERILLLTDAGTLVVATVECNVVNSPFTDRRLKHPIQNPVFFLPTHASHVKIKWELRAVSALARLGSSSSATTEPPSQASPLARGPSYSPNKALCSSPTWTNCFGQRLTAPISSLDEELRMHAEDTLPMWLHRALRYFSEMCVASPGGGGAKPSIAARVLQWICYFFGQSSRASLWWAVHELVGTSDVARVGNTSQDDTDLPEDEIGQGVFPPTRLEYYLARFNLYQGIPYAYPSAISESRSRSSDLKHNRARLVLLRLHALQLQQCRPVDDSRARLVVARELLQLDELGKASEVLLESNFGSTNFAAHAQLALNIAAAQDRRSSMMGSSVSGEGRLSSAFQLTSKRAAAMLLARGDVDGAVEMFVLIQEHYEACLTLQSCGRWVDAAVLAQLAPSVSEERLREILTRWARHCAQRGNIIPSVLLLLKVGALAVVASLLSESSPYTDVAGLFVLFLAASDMLTTQDLSQSVSSPLKIDQFVNNTFARGDENDAIPSLKDVIRDIRGEYAELLEGSFNRPLIQLMDTLLDPALKSANVQFE